MSKEILQHMTFHHIGKPVPLDVIKDDISTRYSPLFDMYTLNRLNELSLPIQLHAFGEALKGQEIIMPLYEPFSGYQCAMILVNHQPIELIETSLLEREIWGDGLFKDSKLYP